MQRLKSLLISPAKALSETPAVIRGHVSYSSQNARPASHGDSVHGIFLKTPNVGTGIPSDTLFSGERNHLPRRALGHKVKRFTPWSLVYKEQPNGSKHCQYVRRRPTDSQALKPNASCPFEVMANFCKPNSFLIMKNQAPLTARPQAHEYIQEYISSKNCRKTM